MGKPARRKRKGPKSTRSGCLMCKPHKHQAIDEPGGQEARARVCEREYLAEVHAGPPPGRAPLCWVAGRLHRLGGPPPVCQQRPAERRARQRLTDAAAR